MEFLENRNWGGWEDEDGSSFYAKQFGGIVRWALNVIYQGFYNNKQQTLIVSQQLGMVQFFGWRAGLYCRPKYDLGLCLISCVWTEGLFALELTWLCIGDSKRTAYYSELVAGQAEIVTTVWNIPDGEAVAGEQLWCRLHPSSMLQSPQSSQLSTISGTINID